MIDLIRDQQIWTKNQIRKRSESAIQRIQTHGDEMMLTRVNDAALLGLRQTTEGEEAFRNNIYLPAAVAGGDLAAQMFADNLILAALIRLQKAVTDYVRLSEQAEGESPIPAQIENEEGLLIDNPVYAAATARMSECVALFDTATPEQWQLVAQRFAGG